MAPPIMTTPSRHLCSPAGTSSTRYNKRMMSKPMLCKEKKENKGKDKELLRVTRNTQRKRKKKKESRSVERREGRGSLGQAALLFPLSLKPSSAHPTGLVPSFHPSRGLPRLFSEPSLVLHPSVAHRRRGTLLQPLLPLTPASASPHPVPTGAGCTQHGGPL